MTTTAKEWVKGAVLQSGATRLAAKFSPPGAALLMYHSVLDAPASMSGVLGNIAVSTDVFRGQMELLARKYSPVSLDDILLFVQGAKKLPQRAVLVTFDDGYLDNLEVAIPILNHYGVPAVFYVTVECIERDCGPWVSRLRYAFHNTKKNGWSDSKGNVWDLSGTEKREEAYLAACEICACLTGMQQDEFVSSAEDELDIDTKSVTKKLMMTWDQVRQVVKEGHTIGSHTMTHPNMAHVEDSDLRREFRESKQILERQLGMPVPHFSYPCPILQPHWTDHTIDVCRETGYATAVTTNSGLVRKGDDPLKLHRIPPTKEVRGLQWYLELTFLGKTV